MSLTAAASTILRITNFLMALSLGTQRAQLVQRMGCTWPRPFLARPLFLLFLVCGDGRWKNTCVFFIQVIITQQAPRGSDFPRSAAGSCSRSDVASWGTPGVVVHGGRRQSGGLPFGNCSSSAQVNRLPSCLESLF
uniref:Uncharacterized protein n=1 Tax=Monodelphis domestica TaxID=13616 RepID=A0A5F8GWU4_MONDO